MSFTASELLKMALHDEKIIYPNPELSISMFCHKFPLPVISLVNMTVPLDNFFAESEPRSFDFLVLAKFAVPSKSVIKKLILDAPHQWEAGKHSISYAHLPSSGLQRLHFGVLGYWKKVVELREIRLKWLQAEQWICDT